MASSRLGEVKIDIDPSEARPDQEVTVKLFFVPNSAAKLLGIAVGLEGVVSGSGTRSTTHTHKLTVVDAAAPFIPRSVRAGEPVETHAKIRIPAQAPPTFHAADNDLIWTLKCTIEIDDWPDWSDRLELAVRPG